MEEGKMEERKMTIARGLTRLKTIKAQLEKNREILQFSVVNSKKKTRLGNMQTDLATNLKETEKLVKATLQSSDDLIKEYMRIKIAINVANLKTVVTIAGKQFSLAEAMLLRQDVQSMYRGISSTYATVYNQVSQEVQRFNDSILQNSNTTQEEKKILMAEVLSFVSFENMKDINNFCDVFMAEVDGTLNEVNAITEISI